MITISKLKVLIGLLLTPLVLSGVFFVGRSSADQSTEERPFGEIQAYYQKVVIFDHPEVWPSDEVKNQFYDACWVEPDEPDEMHCLAKGDTHLPPINPHIASIYDEDTPFEKSSVCLYPHSDEEAKPVCLNARALFDGHSGRCPVKPKEYEHEHWHNERAQNVVVAINHPDLVGHNGKRTYIPYDKLGSILCITYPTPKNQPVGYTKEQYTDCFDVMDITER